MPSRQTATATSHVHELRQSAEQAVDATRHLASDAVRYASDSLGEASNQVRQTVARGTDTASRVISEQPVKSVLIAAAAGAAITALAMSLAQRRY